MRPLPANHEAAGINAIVAPKVVADRSYVLDTYERERRENRLIWALDPKATGHFCGAVCGVDIVMLRGRKIDVYPLIHPRAKHFPPQSEM